MPLMTRSPALQRMRDSSKVVRDFVEEKIIEPKRRTRLNSLSESKDFLDNLMNYIDSQKSQKQQFEDDVDMDRQSALFALVSCPVLLNQISANNSTWSRYSKNIRYSANIQGPIVGPIVVRYLTLDIQAFDPWLK